MNKSLEELKNLFSNFDGNLQAEFIEQFPEIWDDAYDIMMGSRYHRVMTSCMLAGWFAAIKAVSDREKKLMEGQTVGYFFGLNGQDPTKALRDFEIEQLSKTLDEAKIQANNERIRGEFFDNNATVEFYSLEIKKESGE